MSLWLIFCLLTAVFSLGVFQTETINDKKLIEKYVAMRKINEYFSTFEPVFLLRHYFPGELLTNPFAPSSYVQFVIDGKLLLYDMPDEDSTVMLQTSYTQVCVLGEIELLDTQFTPFFVEALTDVHTLALPLEQYRSNLLNDPAFLRHVCISLSRKLTGAVIDSPSRPLKARILCYIQHRDQNQPITDISGIAKLFNVSKRQLLRVLKELCEEGHLVHSAKGCYCITGRGRLQR